MSIFINTNIDALFASNALMLNNREISRATQQLSTGSRINSAADDAAGLAISDKMTAQIRGLEMAVRNANGGINLLQTADGAMSQQTGLLQRMRELAVQSSSDTTLSTDKGYLDTEFQALLVEVDRIGNNTQWNGANVLDASGGYMANGDYSFQVGANANQTITVKIGEITTAGVLSAVASGSVSASATASSAISNIDLALAAIDTQRATLGAGINRLGYAAENLTNAAQNVAQSRSQILDTDYAQAASRLARAQIIRQAATAMLAQANQQPQMVLALLK